jgi:hypothetical protein
MKNIIFSIVFSIIAFATNAQILCVQSFHQNDSIGVGVGANNLIMNGGMENSTCRPGYIIDYLCQNATSYSCNLANWTCTGGGTSTYACIFDSTSASRSLVPEGGRAVYLGNSFCTACSTTSDDTSCIGNAGCVVTGIPSGYPQNSSYYGGSIGCTLQQTVNGLIPSNTYVLEFWAGGEVNSSYFDADGLFAVDVGFGNIMLRDKPTPYGTGIGTRFIIIFRATSTTHTIKFINWGHICSNCTELVLDNVRLYLPKYLPEKISNCSLDIVNYTSQNDFLVYPNPANGTFSIQTNSIDKQVINLFDVNGKLVLRKIINGKITIDASSLSEGVYDISISNNVGVTNKKLVIVR